MPPFPPSPCPSPRPEHEKPEHSCTPLPATYYLHLSLLCSAFRPLVRCQNFRRVRRRAVVLLSVSSPQQLCLLLDLLRFLLVLLSDVRAVPQRPERQDRHEQDTDDGPADEDPAEALDLGLGVAAERDGDLVVDLLDLRESACLQIQRAILGKEKREDKEKEGGQKGDWERGAYRALDSLLLLANSNLAVIKHAPDVVVQRRQLLAQRLRQYVRLVLQNRPFLPHLLV